MSLATEISAALSASVDFTSSANSNRIKQIWLFQSFESRVPELVSVSNADFRYHLFDSKLGVRSRMRRLISIGYFEIERCTRRVHRFDDLFRLCVRALVIDQRKEKTGERCDVEKGRVLRHGLPHHCTVFSVVANALVPLWPPTRKKNAEVMISACQRL
jgi:hypothetical protein